MKLSALLLITGGIVGGVNTVGILVFSIFALLRQQEEFHPMFRQHIKTRYLHSHFGPWLNLGSLWTVCKGVDLWRGLSEGYLWGKILFSPQFVRLHDLAMN